MARAMVSRPAGALRRADEPAVRSGDIQRSEQHRPVRLEFAQKILAPHAGLDVRAVFDKGPHDVPLVRAVVIVQRFAAHRTGNRGFGVASGEGDDIPPAIVVFAGLRERQRPLVGQTEAFQNRQDRRELNVLFRLFKPGDRRGADPGDFREALLGDA